MKIKKYFKNSLRDFERKVRFICIDHGRNLKKILKGNNEEKKGFVRSFSGCCFQSPYYSFMIQLSSALIVSFFSTLIFGFIATKLNVSVKTNAFLKWGSVAIFTILSPLLIVTMNYVFWKLIIKKDLFGKNLKKVWIPEVKHHNKLINKNCFVTTFVLQAILQIGAFFIVSAILLKKFSNLSLISKMSIVAISTFFPFAIPGIISSYICGPQEV